MFEWVHNTPLKSTDIAAHYETPIYYLIQNCILDSVNHL